MVDDAKSAALARVSASFARQPMMDTLAASLVKVAPGVVHIAMPNQPALRQHHGYLHGGALMAVADSAAGYAGMTLVGEHAEVLTVEAKTNFLRPARAGIIAKGNVIKPGRRLIVVSADVYEVGADSEERAHVATMLMTLAVLEGTIVG